MIPGTQIESAARQGQAFDHSFTLPAREPEDLQSLVLVQAGGHAYALPFEHVVGIEHERRVITAPSGVASLVGLSAVGGGVLPVFSLDALLHGSAAPMSDDWFRKPIFAVLEAAPTAGAQAASHRLGIAFERPFQFVQLGRDAFHQPAGSKAAHQTAEHETILYTLLHASALLERILQPHGTVTGKTGEPPTR